MLFGRKEKHLIKWPYENYFNEKDISTKAKLLQMNVGFETL